MEKCTFHILASRTTFGKRLIKYKGSQMWNNLPENVNSTQPVSVFKNLPKEFSTNARATS